jgi:polyvinyl alcohol dehydrogenase (cytochrome)
MARANAILFSAATLFACTAFLGAQAPAPPPPQAPPGAQGAGGAPPGGRGGGAPGTESGWATFQGQCFVCHGNTATNAKTTAWQIRQMTPERIVAGLNAPTHKEGQALSAIQKQRIGEFMSGRPLGSVNNGDAAAMPNRCSANPQMANPASSPSWNGWGNDLANTRFQPAAAARLTATDVPRLKLKWAFGIPYGMTNNAQPTVVSGRVFMGTDNGYIY